MVVAGCRTEDGTSVSDRSVTRRRPSTEWTCGSVAATATLDEIPTEVRLLVIRSTQPCIPPGSLNRVSASAGGKGGNVTSAGWQVTLCDPMWHVSSRSGVATLRTAIGYTCYYGGLQSAGSFMAL